LWVASVTPRRIFFRFATSNFDPFSLISWSRVLVRIDQNALVLVTIDMHAKPTGASEDKREVLRQVVVVRLGHVFEEEGFVSGPDRVSVGY
jgi:hypothetical protein